MKAVNLGKQAGNERRWLLISNSSIHGIQRSELVVLKRVPHRSMVQSSVSVFSVSKSFGWFAGLALAILLLLFLVACQLAPAQKGGTATTTVHRPGHTNSVTLTQSENPKQPSRQTVQSEQTVEYVLPPGSAIQLATGRPEYGAARVQDGETTRRQDRKATKRQDCGTAGPWDDWTPGSGTGAQVILQKPMAVRVSAKDRTETSIGGAQKDTAGEWASKVANIQPVMWAGIAMMTLVTGS